VTRAPAFHSADLRDVERGGMLARRRVGRAAALSLALHIAGGSWLLILGLMDVGPVPPPPLTIRFFAAPPPPPRLVPMREAHTPPPPRVAPQPAPAAIPPLAMAIPEPERPAPPPVQVEPAPPPIRVADVAPSVTVHDAAPPAPAATKLAPLGAHTTPQIGTGEEPDLVLLRPGEDRARSAGGEVAGRDQVSADGPGDPLGGIRRGGGEPGGGPGGAAPLGSEGAFTGTGLASYLGRKYGVTLMDASRLGSRTSDGSRYALLVPALSEAYRSMPFHGRRRGAEGDPVESVQVDAQAIAIRYRDGTVHVLVPTADGLVALYVSAGASNGRSKVQEAERALEALQRLQHGGMRG
jgi:hypothetical protein